MFIFIVYTLYFNLIHDSQASEFLSHKINLDRPVKTMVWLKVMYFHVSFACIALVSGAINFSNQILRKYRRLHRLNGYIYLAAVLLVVITSGYMAPHATGGKISSMAFNILNLLWPIITITAIVKIKQKQIAKHRKWMVRSYAFCFTNLIIHLFTFIQHNGFHVAYETSYIISIYSTILVLAILTELINRRIYNKTAIGL